VGVIRHFNLRKGQDGCAILPHMPNYRRVLIPGGCFFFTVNLLERRQTLLVDEIEGLREAVATTRRGYPYAIDAFVVLPDHLHMIWTQPAGDSDFSNRFAKALPVQERLNAVRKARGECGIWQRQFWERLIRDTADYARQILLYRSAQAQTCRPRARLAVLVVSSRRARGTVSGGLGRRHRNDRRFWGAPVIAGRPSRRCFTRGVRGLRMADYAYRAALGADQIGYNPPYSPPHWPPMSAMAF
jgi:putative transposase